MITGVTITVKDKQWSVSVANTLTELTQGLSGVESIPAQTGMLFDLGSDQKHIEIDMSQMLFPLDIIFINSTQGVVGVFENVQPGEQAILDNDVLPGARLFLEVNAGEAQGIEDGDSVDIQGYAHIYASPVELMLNAMPSLMVMSAMVGLVGAI